ncbi:hypothetical protein GCM10011374_35570 [Kocuria dechangensis]|uniref:Uncharacterized protein n=1 Tax=Kocuria dechangensis TaxID=1176249 RepID=A0A917M098_9MICC|nr:hypothetical protein [Kocuria dechangensis]GGG68143.1 hypothetical protein GCM10011374_35570 [Kocuria dechangensis]
MTTTAALSAPFATATEPDRQFGVAWVDETGTPCTTYRPQESGRAAFAGHLASRPGTRIEATFTLTRTRGRRRHSA